MAEVPQVPLKEFFKLFAPTYVLGTTYTVSLAFFEGLVFPEIKRSLLRRCLILCDKLGFQRATVESSALRSVGREYMAICAPTSYAFHPKVWLMVGEGKLAVLVGSGNLTQSGFMDNAEAFDVMQFTVGGPNRAVVDDLAGFVHGLRSLWTGADAEKLLAIKTLDDIGRELATLSQRMPDDPNPSARFFSNFDRPLVEQFGDVFLGGKLRVAAPYFGGETSGVQLLQEKLAPSEMDVFPAVHRGDELDVNLADLRELPGVSIKSLKLTHKDKEEFAHLKLYGFDSEKGQWLFTTSANCTVAALGGKNVEAGLLRRADRATLETFFAEHPKGTLPEGQRHEEFYSGEAWLALWASDLGEAVELIVNDARRVPLTSAIITIKAAGHSESRSYPSLFVSGMIARIEWSQFRQLTDRKSHPALISISATDALGHAVHGDALIDNPLLLSSDPTHRSAWRAALSLLEGEGLPESADLASIFHLVQEVFDADDERANRDDGGVRTAKGASRRAIPDKVPIWPPIAHHEWMGTFSGSDRLHDLQWFQKILAEFLNPKNHETDGKASPAVADGIDAETTALAKQVQIPATVVKSVWKEASRSYQQMRKRLMHLIVNENSARKIWPVATAVFLVTLVTRRQIVAHADITNCVDTVADLVRSFLQMLFADRLQPADEMPPTDCRYMHAAYPSLATDLMETFKQRPSADIAGIICLSFAYWHASEQSQGRPIPFLPWLLFREVVPDVACGAEWDLETMRTAFDKYLFDDSTGVEWTKIETSLLELAQVDWPHHQGYQDLEAIMCRAQGIATTWNFPPHLEDLWLQAERRVRAGISWHFDVDPFVDTCPADRCSGQYVSDPKKRKDLRRCAPTICSSCGSVLVPDRLWRAYENAHEQDS